ncbi:outer membrane lipoprotein-sorting protein [Desulfobotulus sp. H1]|uniref:Outer membrane lipoprotein-sorting protein n=1 Tax=Desulfobotulus pelophilus TaxID=2823377 RepID=A0ABT3NBN2_9BACT|nr:outer membrane lipoprotein-sorting protein [Desulfobotulus pelophilus]MCW7754880.1 outer membrane lipoprotein-sorting protein [Desulfobotulus pelophilus]
MLHKILLPLISSAFIMAGSAMAEIGPFNPETTKDDGRQLAEIVEDFNRPEQDLSILGTMTLLSGERTTDTRQVAIRQKAYGPTDRYVLRFLDSIKRGVTFLTIENEHTDNDQYLYIPALGRARKVAVNDRQNAFEDTDFSYEDLGGRKIDDYLHERRSDALFNGRECYRVEAISKDASARYPRQLSWIDKENFLPLQVRFFGRDGSLERVIVAGEVQKIEGIHIPFRTVAKDLKANHTTIIEARQALVNTGVDSMSFDPDRMGDTWR